jgi:hypothetical protein
MIRDKLNGFLSQSCEADIGVTPAGKDMTIQLNKYRGSVSILRALLPFQAIGATSNELEEKSYQRFDLTAIRLAIATGEHLAMKVETRDGEKMTYELTGASKDKKTGKEIFSVKAVSGSLLPALGAITGASIEILGGSIAVLALPDLPIPSATWDDAKQKLIFPIFPWDNDYYAKVLNYAIANKEPVAIEATRAGSTKKEKKMVRYVSSYKVDGNKIEVVLWNKGLKSKGKFAGNAVNGFSSGNYTIQSIRLLPTHDNADLFNDDCFDDGFDYSYQPISVEAGFLEKAGDGPGTTEFGAFELNFKLDPLETRLLSFDKKKNEVSSASVSRYFRDFERYLRRASNELGGSANFVGFGLSDGKTVVGEIKSLRNNNGRYMTDINLAFNDAEELKNTTSVETFFFGDGLWRGVVSR